MTQPNCYFWATSREVLNTFHSKFLSTSDFQSAEGCWRKDSKVLCALHLVTRVSIGWPAVKCVIAHFFKWLCDCTFCELVVWLYMLHCVGVILFSLPWLNGARFYTPPQWDCTLEALRTVVLLSKSILLAVLNIEHWTLNNIAHCRHYVEHKYWTLNNFHAVLNIIVVHAALNIWFHIIFQWLPTGSGDGPQEAKIVRCDSF